MTLWKANMRQYRKQGVMSLSGLVTKLLYEQLEKVQVEGHAEGKGEVTVVKRKA
jgi:hypothetical protein